MVLPSWHEGMANTNLEGASAGRPVITSNIPGCQEAVIDGVTGFIVEKRNVDSLYDKMKQMLLLSRSDREKMGRSGHEHMARVFDKKLVVKKTVDRLFDL